MHKTNNARLWLAIGASSVLTLAACKDNPLAVKNTDRPDVPRVLSTPRGTEALVGGLFQQMWNAQQNNFGVGVQSTVMSFESHSGLANFGFGARANIPRQLTSNALGNSEQTEIFNDFDKVTRATRSAANGVAALQAFVKAGTSAGSKARDARAISFGFFNIGFGLANVALMYDSAAIITPAVPSDVVPPLSPYADVMKVALAMLDSAIAVSASADATNGADGWPFPAGWISGNPAMTITQWQQIIRSYKARFRAGVARTPAERAQGGLGGLVDWNAIAADAAGGITADFNVNADAASGWGNAVRNQFAVDATWSQMPLMILGMADTTRAYDAWLGLDLNSRVPFLIRTPDKRFPSGDTRGAQNLSSGAPAKSGTPPGTVLYFYNRLAGDDKPQFAWGSSFYDNQRFWGVRFNGQNGPIVMLSKAENDLLRAEALIITGKTDQAIPLINLTRVRAGLPAIAVTTDKNAIVPGGTACVPRVPVAPGFTTTACGTVFDALKWEKRVETSFTGYAQWYIDSRGWGDLTRGTVLEWAVPWQELYARQNLTIYTTTRTAGSGNYGCPGPLAACP